MSLDRRDVLAGQLAATLPALPQAAYEAAADALLSLGWRPPATLDATASLLAAHEFVETEDGDGWNEPRWREFSCKCRKITYGEWTQRDPQNTGLSEFLEEGHYDSIQLHHTHVAEILAAAGGGVPS